MSWSRACIAAYVDELDDESLPETALLVACGRPYFESLRAAVGMLHAASSAATQLDELIDIATTALSKAQGASILNWRQFAADVFILRSLTSLDASTCLDAIGLLDRALIVTGGAGRADLVHDLIKRIQSDFASAMPCPQFPSQHLNPLSYQPAAHHKVPRLASPPSLSLFRTQLCQRPFVLPNYAHDWPALNQHPWRSMDYLRSVSGPGRVVPVEVGSDYRTPDWSQKLMGWDDFLLSLHTEAPLYLAQHNLFMQFPQLQDDIVVPDYVYTAPSAPTNYPNYTPPNNDNQLILNSWLGPGATVSPAHTDPYFNIYIQVVGCKSVWLAPPECSQYMYPSQPTNDMSGPSMSNTSRVNVFRPDEDEGLDRYPSFRAKVILEAMHVTLEPGDVLFFPPGWWHAMRANNTSFSVSMWF